MKKVALTFIGRDRAGIVAAVTRILYQSRCNIEDTTMTILEGEFAMILIASLSHGLKEALLRKKFAELKKRWGISCFWEWLPGNLRRGEKHLPRSETYILSVMGKDRTGIVYETSRILTAQKLNITDLNSKILGEGEKSVFIMLLEVDIPKKMSLKRLKTALDSLKKRMRVEVALKPAGRVSF